MRHEETRRDLFSRDTSRQRAGRMYRDAIAAVLGLIAVAGISAAAYAATHAQKVEEPTVLDREWRYELEVVDLDGMFSGPRQIELKRKR